MAYDTVLAERVRLALANAGPVEEKRMFRGLTFMVGGKMCVSVSKERLMFRIDPAIHDAAVKREGCSTMTMKGRQYRGYICVVVSALRTKRQLDYWIALALEYNRRLQQEPRKS